MTSVTIAVAVIFGTAAGILGMYAYRAGRSEIRFGAPTPLFGQRVRDDEKGWNAAHRRAAPYLWTAALIGLIQAVSLGVLVAYPGLLTWGYMIALSVTGVALILLLLALASRPAR